MNNTNSHLSLKVAELFQAQGLMLSSAESCTGGLLASEITAIAGSSTYFDRGFITYSNEAKHEVLDVDYALLQHYGAVSESVAAAMARGALIHSHADIAISITGIAGPRSDISAKPVGLVWFGVATKQGVCETRMAQFHGERQQVRAASVGFALEWLIETAQRSRLMCI